MKNVKLSPHFFLVLFCILSLSREVSAFQVSGFRGQPATISLESDSWINSNTFKVSLLGARPLRLSLRGEEVTEAISLSSWLASQSTHLKDFYSGPSFHSGLRLITMPEREKTPANPYRIQDDNRDRHGHKSPLMALGLSTIPQFTLLSSGIMLDNEYIFSAGFLSVVLLGSAGHIYAGEYRRAIIQTSIRVGGTGIFLGGLALAVLGGTRAALEGIFGKREEDDTSGGMLALGIFTALGGLAVIGVSYIYDVIDSPAAVNRYNTRHGYRSGTKFIPIISINEGDKKVVLMLQKIF